METAAREQTSLILGHLVSSSDEAFQERVKTIYASHAARGHLKSGSTVKAALRAAEEISEKFLSNAIAQVAPVAKDVEAFALICDSFDRYLSRLSTRMDSVASTASGRPSAIAIHDSVVLATRREFNEMRTRLTRRLEIHRFTFTQSSERLIPRIEPKAPEKARAHKGGRPPAEFWDDMWAAIATALYSGELQPKSQADVQRAMSEWIEAHDFSAADSTIKARARRLWDLIAALDE